MPGAVAQKVRRAVPDDAGTLANLCAAHAAYERIPYSAEGHAQRLHAALASGQLHAWLLENDGLAQGYASVTLDFATLSGLLYAHMDCLYLAPCARNQGGGRALMQAVQVFAVAQGCAELQWQTPQWNHNAARFYDRMGACASAKQRYSLSLAGALDRPRRSG
jgi:GNAT superfamily N-acetyltransferase